MKRIHPILTFAVALVFLAGCDSFLTESAPAAEGMLAEARGGPKNVVEVTATHNHTTGEHLFELSAEEIPSGWTTFRFNNESHATHFVQVEKLPVFKGKQITVEDAKATVVPAFQALMDLIIEEDKEPLQAFLAVINKFPAWFLAKGYTYMGGPGLTAPGRTSKATVYLEPGTYAIECYVKGPDGTFHTTVGMIEGLVVTKETSRAREPKKATLEITLSSTEGIEVEGKLRPGKHTIAVHFADQAAYGHFLGHDVHLARLENDTDLEALNAWMSWAEPAGLTTPAPAEFLGGVQDMTAGSTAYFTVVLKPGRYAWIAEVPNPDEKGMLDVFEIPTRRRGR